ncbi:MAG TPA: HAMP domain-containing sensor histidine kinase, partial [Bacteroidales bacterium]|nr:HAMP domain-containing sensor histidine kinase [Bacteroidales bacterium]
GPQIGEGIYLNTGAGITQLLGISPEDFTESLFHGMIEEIIPLSDDIPLDSAKSRSKFINGDIKTYMAELLMRTSGGVKKWIFDTSVPLHDEETGSIIGSQGVLYNDSHRMKILDSVIETRVRADETDRLKAAFLHNISHEIRTPLNAIVGFSTLLTEYLDSPEKRREYLDVISRSSDHLLEIIDDIVEISKIEAKSVKITRERVNIDLVLWKIYEQLRHMASEKGIVLNYVVMPESSSPEVYTDGYKLMQVLKNLVSNGLKFTCEGRVEYGYGRKGGMIEFYVSDTGIGIPSGQQSFIFSRFYQGDCSEKRNFGGTGLGLSISKAYIELLGGDIWFTSRPGEGSVFRFTIPE